MTEQVMQNEITPQEVARRKTFNRNKWFFSVGGIGRDISYALIGSFLLTYIQFGVNLTIAQFTTLSIIIGVGGRIWDAINDPIMGAIIESSHLKWGKFRPWIFIGAISCSAIILLMFNIQSLEGWAFVIFMIVMYLLWESTFTMNDIGYWSMLPSLSSVNKERNTATMMTVLFAGIGAIAAQGVIPMITTGNMRAGYRLVAIITAALFIGFQILTSFGCKETARPVTEKAEKVTMKKMWNTIKKNDQILWMTLSMLFYNVGSALLTALAANLIYSEISYNGDLYFVIVVAYGVTSVFVNIVYPWLVNKWGRKKLQLISIITASAGYALMALVGLVIPVPQNILIYFFGGFAIFVSAGQSLFYMASIVNMTNCVEYNQYKQGERNEAVVSTLRPFMAKFGAAVQTLIVTIVLAVSGIYGLSQNISSLETQKSMFDDYMGSQANQIVYVTRMQEYLEDAELIHANFDKKTNKDAYNEEIAKLEAKIESDSIMKGKQINPETIAPLADSYISVQVIEKDAAGKEITIDRIIGKLGDISSSQISEALNTAEEDKQAERVVKYSLKMVVGEPLGEANKGLVSAADNHFKSIIAENVGMRIQLRIAVTLVPVVLLVIALIIQRKKFIIDEEYYDMMLADIASKEQAVIEQEGEEKQDTIPQE